MGGFRDIFRQLWHWWDSPAEATPDVIITFVGALAEDVEFTGALASVVAWDGALADTILFTGSISG